MVTFFRWLLFPISCLYASIVWLRNRLYDFGLLKQTSFKIPTVVIGNLAVGGTGKSPMTEYILKLIKSDIKAAVLSRGYGRQTKGFRFVEVTDRALDVGDEPLQIKRKFPDTTVAVCEDRVHAIKKLEDESEAVLLDDAFQHRALAPSFSILLFDFDSLLKPAIALPTGNFRDALRESRRSDIMVITKCPANMTPAAKSHIETRLRKYSPAPIYYAKIAYHLPVNDSGKLFDEEQLPVTHVLLLTGIAKPSPLVSYLTPKVKALTHRAFKDHHTFSEADINEVVRSFQSIPEEKKIIITTEKDFQRLPNSFIANYPLFYIPIQQEILFEQGAGFESEIKKAFRLEKSVN